MTLAGHDPHGSGRQIVWDGLGLETDHSGIGHYARNLYKSLAALGCEPVVTSPLESHLDFVPVKRRLTFDAVNRVGVLKPIFPILSYRATQRSYSAAVYHGLSNINIPSFYPLRRHDKFVITVHDIIPLIKGRSSMLGVQMRLLLPRAIEVADAIIVPSKWTKSSLIQYVGTYAESKISVIPNGTAQLYDEAPILSAQAQKKSVDVLAIGRGESYKRLEYLRDLAKALPKKTFSVVTDRRGASLLAHAPSNLKILVGVGPTQMKDLLLAARVFVHPSLFEGWCLPAADALSAGLRVVYTTGSGIDEVCAHAPDQSVGLSPSAGAAEWADTVCNEIKYSIENSYQPQSPPMLPTWKNNAEKTLKIYEALL